MTRSVEPALLVLAAQLPEPLRRKAEGFGEPAEMTLVTTIGAVCLGRGSGHTKALPYREATWVTPSSSAPRLPPTVTPIDIRF